MIALGGELDILEYLLNAMNDENLPGMRRQAIARKIAPYFHPKPKRVPTATCGRKFSIAAALTDNLAICWSIEPTSCRRCSSLR